jgi:hypothetical protein
MIMLLSALLLPAVAATPPEMKQAASAPTQSNRICQDMLLSSSRLGVTRVCKTRAAWERWRRCHSATRYCDPPRQQTLTVASMPGETLICKYLKTTGSRLAQQKVCATKRQWELVELETQETVRDRQNQSMRLPGQQ